MVQSLYSVDEAQDAIWVFLEHAGGQLEGVSLELLSRGRQLADEASWEICGLLLGHQVAELSELAIAHGADKVLLVEHPLLEVFTVDAYAFVTHFVLTERKPSIFLAGATPNGRDLAGRLGVRLRTGLTADCTDLRLDPKTGILVSEVTGFGGGVLALIESPKHRPQMATVRPGVFPPGEADPGRMGDTEQIEVEIPEGLIQTTIVEQSHGEGVDLTQTPALVVGGRGVEGDFGMLRELATLLGGDVGATRPPVDDGYIERERQIGQTGVVCRPKVAVVCGVSGAFQFVVGIQDADLVIAINSDPEAAIFEYADYCIVGDAARIVPELTQALRTGEKVLDV